MVFSFYFIDQTDITSTLHFQDPLHLLHQIINKQRFRHIPIKPNFQKLKKKPAHEKFATPVLWASIRIIVTRQSYKKEVFLSVSLSAQDCCHFVTSCNKILW